MFTKQHYTLIAEMVRGNTCLSSGADVLRGRTVLKSELVQDLVEFLAADNQGFDEATFREACGPV